VKVALACTLGALVAFVAFTAWVLESGGVAVVDTRAPDGSTRSTHVWYVEPDGQLWLEAGTPDNSWYRDVLRDSTLEFHAEGRSQSYRAEPVLDSAAQARVRSLIREKYGYRDWWVGRFIDSSGSIAVRLEPVSPR
jgi:hypothetical protein